jgi:hypothetical protein
MPATLGGLLVASARSSPTQHEKFLVVVQPLRLQVAPSTLDEISGFLCLTNLLQLSHVYVSPVPVSIFISYWSMMFCFSIQSEYDE